MRFIIALVIIIILVVLAQVGLNKMHEREYLRGYANGYIRVVTVVNKSYMKLDKSSTAELISVGDSLLSEMKGGDTD